MKRIFSIFAAALIVFGAASCKKSDKKGEPATSFTIAISDIADDGCTYTVTPPNDNVEYMCLSVEKELLGNDLVKTMELVIAAEDLTYTDAKNNGLIHQKKISEEETPELKPSTQYVIAVFQIDEQLKVVGDVTLSESFSTLPYGYVDLGLTDGILWSAVNTPNATHPGDLWTWNEAVEYSDFVPTKEQWIELINNCDWEWNDEFKAFVVSSRTNGRYILIYALGNGTCGTTEVLNKGSYTFYWSSTQSSQDYAWAFIGSKDEYNNYEEDMSKCEPLALRLVAPNPNKK